MPNLNALSIDPSSARGKILSNVDPDNFKWAIPIMRSGYAGRGLTYLVVAGVSLWSMFQGGEAQGTQSALQSMSGGWGTIVVALIVAGLIAYAIWRVIDSIWDLEAHGTDGKGIIARLGMIVTGLAHAGIAVIAAGVLGYGMSGGGGSGGQSMIASALQTTWGTWAMGLGGLATIGAAVYYAHKAYTQSYRDNLAANEFTMNYNLVLQIGVIAQGFIVGFIGVVMVYAALNSDASQLGGLGSVFEWLRSQPFGQVLSVVFCFGLLAFAVFCFVNAAYRVVPKAAGPDLTTVSAKIKQMS